ncbi:hypothetical protein Tco_1245514 [Tanacetum coccineum]
MLNRSTFTTAATLDKRSWTMPSIEILRATKESKVASLEAEKVKLEAAEASLRQELKNAKQDRAEVVSKVVPYVATELVLEEVANIKETFDILKVKDPHASIETLFSKKPQANPSSTLTSQPLSPPSQVTPMAVLVTMPQSPPRLKKVIMLVIMVPKGSM